MKLPGAIASPSTTVSVTEPGVDQELRKVLPFADIGLGLADVIRLERLG
jgi:hypothetical protein